VLTEGQTGGFGTSFKLCPSSYIVLMNILQIVQDLSRDSTGVQSTAKSFNRAFRELGYNVSALSFDRGYHPAEERPPDTVSVPTLNIPGLRRYVFSLSAFRGKYDEFLKAADIIFIHNLYGHQFTWAAHHLRTVNKPCYVVPHGTLTSFCLSRRALIKKAWLTSVREFIEKQVCLVCSADYERSQAVQFVQPARTAVLYWPTQQCPEIEVDGTTADTEERTLLLVGRLHPMKRTLETINSFRRVRRGSWRLCLAGPPSPEIGESDIRRVAGEDWGHSVEYLGNLPRNELNRWYRRARGIILFSKGDNYSHVVAEALLAGCPAYVSQDVGLGDLVQQHGCGRMFNIATDTDLDNALSGVLSGLAGDRPSGERISGVARRELSFPVFKERVGRLLKGSSGVL
jgi:glycosyltransferase involved in cell wall biosynthesis